MRLELSDLPPHFRAQAQRQLDDQARHRMVKRHPEAAAYSERDFDSRGEWEFYLREVLPNVECGALSSFELHPCFALYPPAQYGSLKLGALQYTADFRLNWADGRVEIVEVKSRFVRRMQRDYPIRRRVFLEKIAAPAGWGFREVITGDTRDVKRWEEMEGQCAKK